MNYIDFVPGKWYYCSCNELYYRFLKITKKRDKITADAVINPTKKEILGVSYGFHEKRNSGMMTCYFNANKKVPNKLLIKYIQISDYSYELY